jgi:hypothetical protein
VGAEPGVPEVEVEEEAVVEEAAAVEVVPP